MFYMYGASKHAVTALTEGLRRELVNSNSKIRVTVSVKLSLCYKKHFNVFGCHNRCYFTQSLSPGLVHTEIMEAGHMRTFTSRDIFNGNPCLHPQDIADAVLYILGTPPHVQVGATLHSLGRLQVKILLP